jgi:ABC-type uncharacterized transport system permease subunit
LKGKRKMNWKPINKVLVGAIVGAAVLLAERLVPAWRTGIPANVQALLPYVTAMVAAYLVKLESNLPNL